MNKSREKVIKALEHGTAIPAGPMVLSRITQLCRNPDATARDLAKVIQLDGTLATKVLRQVNSAFYGLSSQVKTVTHAVVILGFDEVKHLALTVPAAQLFHNNRHGNGIDVMALWDNTLIVACLARTLSYHIKHPMPEQVFVSGILAKTGMIVLNTILQDEYADIFNQVEDMERLPFAEKKRLSISHVQLGWMLAKKWCFPEELLDAIAYQYNPAPKGELKVEAGLVFAARRIYADAQKDLPMERIIGGLPAILVKEFKLDEAAASRAVERAANDFDEVRRMLSVT